MNAVPPSWHVAGHQEVGARQSLAIHWGTFILTAEPVDEPPRRLRPALTEAGLPATAFEPWAVGESRNIQTGHR